LKRRTFFQLHVILNGIFLFLFNGKHKSNISNFAPNETVMCSLKTKYAHDSFIAYKKQSL
jgi:hypothetical protein